VKSSQGCVLSEYETPKCCAACAQVFRRRDAKKLKDVQGKPVYKLSDFGVHVSELSTPSASAAKGQQLLHLQGVHCIQYPPCQTEHSMCC
jgi:hypothetical protein